MANSNIIYLNEIGLFPMKPLKIWGDTWLGRGKVKKGVGKKSSKCRGRHPRRKKYMLLGSRSHQKALTHLPSTPRKIQHLCRAGTSCHSPFFTLFWCVTTSISQDHHLHRRFNRMVGFYHICPLWRVINYFSPCSDSTQERRLYRQAFKMQSASSFKICIPWSISILFL